MSILMKGGNVLQQAGTEVDGDELLKTALKGQWLSMKAADGSHLLVAVNDISVIELKLQKEPASV